ncbi:hypothetical protein [Croceicoccus sp. YJ47]|uniref:hypothetical protein n=1 Tax=Croceicoccus sp. YJ47 TaxID=2798724 RepID=UPI0019224E68|nr:hypothetical protein [Croceicoccus sp. YJ47]QQN75018.1 hypothetical protein JD971_04800 [Croceicoccus sp. YJ47]
MRGHINSLGGVDAFAAMHELSPRTAQRLMSGKSLPPSLCAEIAAGIRKDRIAPQEAMDRADALAAYAEANGKEVPDGQ